MTVENAGRSGATTDAIRQRAASIPPDVQIVILQPGGNDQLGGKRQGGRSFDHDQTTANIDAIVKDLRARGIQVLMWQYHEESTGFTAQSSEIADRYGAVFLGEFHDGVPASAHLSDGHMTAEGYALVAQRILPNVKAVIDRLSR